jgi:hypothetical protein
MFCEENNYRIREETQNAAVAYLNRQSIVPRTVRVLLLYCVIRQMNRLVIVLQIELLRAEPQVALFIEPDG